MSEAAVDEPKYASEPDDIRDGGVLRLTEDGIQMPDFLRGFSGTFMMFTPNVDGELETTEEGLPDVEYYDGIFAVDTNSGDYNEWLEAGDIAFETPNHPVTRYTILDER